MTRFENRSVRRIGRQADLKGLFVERNDQCVEKANVAVAVRG